MRACVSVIIKSGPNFRLWGFGLQRVGKFRLENFNKGTWKKTQPGLNVGKVNKNLKHDGFKEASNSGFYSLK